MQASTTCRRRILPLGLALVLAIPSRADAQIVAGQAVEQSTGVALKGLRVLLRRVESDSATVIVGGTLTDERGLFQLVAPGAGTFRLSFGPGRDGLAQGPVDTLTLDTMIQRRYDVPVIRFSTANVLGELEVDEPAAPVAGNPAPRYPSVLREQGVTGEVILNFVVDTTGRMEAGSVFVTKMTHRDFHDAVMAVLPRMRFLPGEIGGVRVRQRVVMPFVFHLGGGPRFPLPPAPGQRTLEPVLRRP